MMQKTLEKVMVQELVCLSSQSTTILKQKTNSFHIKQHITKLFIISTTPDSYILIVREVVIITVTINMWCIQAFSSQLIIL